MPYFALIIMFYHVKIACYQSSNEMSGIIREVGDFRVVDLSLLVTTIFSI